MNSLTSEEKVGLDVRFRRWGHVLIASSGTGVRQLHQHFECDQGNRGYQGQTDYANLRLPMKDRCANPPRSGPGDE